MIRFDDLKLSEPLLRAVRDEGYPHPTPIQAQSIPHVLSGRDLLACAQTGTGKTAAFALPILHKLSAARAPHIRALVLTPTRELAAQIGESFRAYGRHLHVRYTTIYGGVSQQPQEHAIRRGVDILIATPGRLLDLIQQRIVRLDRLEILVLDEADRMLDMGFIHDVRRIVSSLPNRRQTLFFSATLGKEIESLAHDILTAPLRVDAAPAATTVDKVRQTLYHVEKHEKFPLLVELLKDPAFRRTIVFTRTKHGANRLAEKLNKGRVRADAIHGNKGQGARERAIDGLRRGFVRVLVATDVASRGIDIDEISHVINYDMPDVPENYVHRIGRTARAGAEGVAIAFCSREEREELEAVERTIRMRIPLARRPAGLEPEAPAAPPQRRFEQGRPSSGASPSPAPTGQRRFGAPRPHGRRFGR